MDDNEADELTEEINGASNSFSKVMTVKMYIPSLDT